MSHLQQSLPPEVWQTLSDQARLEVLEAVGQSEVPDDPDFDRIGRIAASVFGVPIALVTLVGRERQWFRAHIGTAEESAPAGTSFCAHALAQKKNAVLVVPDLSRDPRFAGNPHVTGPEHMRFYAGAAIVVQGQKIGTVCVLDTVPRDRPSPAGIAQLADLAGLAGSLFALKDEARVRARTAAELIREEWRHALTLEAGKVGSWMWDIRSGEVTANDMLREMFGLEATTPVRMDDLFAVIHPGDIAAVRRAFDAAFEQGVDYVAEYRIAATGRWVMSRGRVYQRDGSGKPLVIMGVNIDMTGERESARQTRLLLRELNHRVKNTLAMIQSLARQTLKQSPDPLRFIDAFSGRLRTLSEAHVLLSDRDWTGIGLIELINTELMPYLSDREAQLVLEGGDLRLPPDHALGLGLIFNELASNAALYGALSTDYGTVEVRWTQPDEADRVEIVWKEQGGPPVMAARRGLGTRLIERSLDKVLDSTVSLSFPVDGVEAKISFPVAESA